MAYDLKSGRIKINQTLHGYSEGHRLVESSVKLAQLDARTMLVLSDASGSGGHIPSEGYLTGYPLNECGKYVLARTWAAPEMSRPGCVWTHSLLIDFADLARLASAEDLFVQFDRPSGDSLTGFGSPIEIELSRSAEAIAGPELERAGQWAGALYGKPKARVVAKRESSRDDDLIAAIWLQQWPRLRRTFRFCSFAVEDRSTSSEIFDLQLIDGSRSARSRVPNGVTASSVQSGDWIEPLLDDLQRPSGSGLRSFLRDIGADVTSGRTAMAPLTRLYTAVNPAAGPERVAEAVSELKRLSPGQAHMGRAVAARVVFSRPDLSDRRLFEFALDEVRSDRDLLGIDRRLVGQALLRWEPDRVQGLIRDSGPLREALEAALLTADADELINILAVVPDATNTILSLRPDILEKPSLWRIASIDGDRLIRSVEVDSNHATAVVTAMIAAGRDDCSSLAIDRYGLNSVVRALSAAAGDDPLTAWSWLRQLAARTGDLAACMAEGNLTYRPLLIGLAATIDPDAVPNIVGQDPWVTAVKHTRASGDDAGEDLLASFLFCRAMGWGSKSSGLLLTLSVQRLHEALAARRLSDVAWRLTNQRLPWVAPWREWDRCERLRRAVVDQFIDRGLPPIEFGTVVDDEKLWSMLVDIAADGSLGRRYLNKVRDALRGRDEARWVKRAHLIDHKVK